MMFRSIRWRLVASYVFLTLLTAVLVGVLALSLVRRYVNQRMTQALTADAESVARQVGPMLWPVQDTAALRELAQTFAFLGDVRVRILDQQGQVLVDSGAPTEVERLMWFAPDREWAFTFGEEDWVMAWPHVWPAMRRQQGLRTFLEELPDSIEGTIVRRVPGMWGGRFTVEMQQLEDELRQLEKSLPALDEAASEANIPRWDQVVVAEIGEGEERVGTVELSDAPDLGVEALATTRRALLLAAAGAVTLALVVGLVTGHRLTAPLRRLTTAADQAGADLSTRVPVQGQDEIGQLARQFNQMTERLQDSFAALAAERDALRRFVADASHELRTPITALKSFNELLRGAAADDPEARAEFLAESAAQLERLEWITHNLLDLSRLDAGLVDLALDEHGATDLIRSASAAFELLAQEQVIDFSRVVPDEPLTLRCDGARVALALGNLLDNAFKFTPEGGHVQIGACVAAQGAQVHFWVQDSGPGIDPADQPHVFERFYRGQGEGAGSGLGLSIVQGVAQAHGGRVWVESEPGAGSRFVMALPVAPPERVLPASQDARGDEGEPQRHKGHGERAGRR